MTEKLILPGSDKTMAKMPGHWVLAKLGKKVLRPGGKELTETMLAGLAITSKDKVVEFAPGMGFTAKICLAKKPKSYTAIEQNEQAAHIVSSYLTGDEQTCKIGSAQNTGLPSSTASVVYGEAMLTMQPDKRKKEIVTEAARILEQHGRYGIHELCIVPSNIDIELKREIQKEIAQAIQAPAKPLTTQEWVKCMEDCGFTVEEKHISPMHLLEPKRMIDDEGLLGFIKIVRNLIKNPDARKRVIGMRKVFKKYQHNLAAISLVAQRTGD